ncbi:hypothetical protein C8R43DRAFT_1118684 [Mycena crocata]|nr:hypothetical protein C8R43DRAFT_1118684 [Mycena crocata]
MTDLSQTSPGTASVPGAANSQGSDGTVAALQLLGAAMTTLAQQQQGKSSGPIPPSHNTDIAPFQVPRQLPRLLLFPPPRPPLCPTPTSLKLPSASRATVLVPGDDGLWYCITKGRYVGITPSNPLALHAVTGVTGNAMKSYKTQAQALLAFNNFQRYGMVTVVA